jgi:putative ABC transport system permease protein
MRAWERVDAWAERLLERVGAGSEAELLVGDLAEERRRRSGEGLAGWRIAVRWAQDLGTGVGPVVRRGRRAVRVVGTRGGRDNREERMRSWIQDVGYAVRSLRSSPWLTAVVVLTLALGIGAGTTVFTVVDNVVLNPFSYPEPDRLIGVGPVYPKLGRELSFWETISPAEWQDIRDQSETLERVVSWDMGNRAVTVGDRTENLFSAFWFGEAFGTLGVTPALGRGFTASEIENGDPVAILSHRIWATRFGADSSLVGEAVLVNGNPYTLVGVMPPGTLVLGTDLWLPMPVSPSEYARGRRQFQVLGRLAAGATLADAERELALIADRIEGEYAAEHPEYEGWTLVPMTWTDVNVRLLKPAALALLGAIGFVLLLVCANVASMLLSRSTRRRREMAVRTALGARRGRIVRQLLTESVMLGLAGAVLGVGLSYLAVGALVTALGSMSLPVPGEIVVDGRVLGFSAFLGLGTGILFGLAPAWYAARPDVRGMLQADSGATAGTSRLRFQRGLVGLEVALALVLLVGGGLLVNSFLRMQRVAPGFDPTDVLTMRLTLAWERYEAEEMEPFMRELTRRLEEHPAVAAAATTTQLPPQVFGQSRFWVEGEDLGTEATLPTAYTTIASPGYFDALEIPLLAGRLLAESDLEGNTMVVVVNEAAADRWFGGASAALGKRFKLGGPDADNPWWEVVGVVGSTQNRGLDAPAAPEVFASVRQLPTANNQHFLVIRAPGAVGTVLPVVREIVAAMDPQQPVYAVRTMEEMYSAASVERRVATVTIGVFSLFALLLAAVGIYAVVSYGVAQRTREIGVRMALGADRGRVRGLVVRQALVPVALGLIVGLGGAVVLGRVIEGLLYEVAPADPGTYVAVVALFATIAGLASYLPARRASSLDPVAALREERR